MKKIALLAILLVTVLGSSLAQEKANWTILHYTAVDNNLEGAAFNDYYEMQVVGSGEGVNIVTQFDRAEGFESRFGDWTDTRRFYMEQRPPLPQLDNEGRRAAVIDYFVEMGENRDSIAAEVAALDDATISRIFENLNIGVSFDQIPVQELGEVDMGDPQALVDFLVWGAQTYPAEHYLVVIGSHGGGWRGIGPDEAAGESMLDLPEIDQALGEARSQLGLDKFDIVGFDACLMGVTDVAVMLEPHADYVLFSQEVIPGNGWEYIHSISAMKANPDWDAFQVGAAFVDTYMEYYAGQGARTKVGLSLVKTEGLPDLLASLQNFAQVVGTNTVEVLSALGTARNNSQLFGTSLGDRAEAYSYVDLRDFMTWFSIQTTITEDAYQAALEVIAAYDNTVVYSLADDKLPRANGLGVYLPSTPLSYEVYGEQYPDLAPTTFGFWQDYLNQFYGTISSELDGSSLQLEILDIFTLGETPSTLDIPVIFFNAGGKGIVELSYIVTEVLDDGTNLIVDTFPISYTSILPTGETLIEYPNEPTFSFFKWGVEFPYVTDGTTSVLALFQSSSTSGNEGIVQGTYVTSQGSQPAYLIFDTKTYEYLGVLAIANDAPYEAKPLPGDQFIVDLIGITTDGETVIEPMRESPLTFGVEPFQLNYAPAPSGNYKVILGISDLAGNSVYKNVEITVNNDDTEGTLRGYTDTNEGIHFVYPYLWGEDYSFTKEDGSLTNAVSNDDVAYAIYVDTYEAEPLEALETAILEIDVEAEEFTETTLNGFPAYFTTYTIEQDSGTKYGAAYSVFNEHSGWSAVLTVEAVGDEESIADIVSLLDNSLTFFPPVLEEE